MIAAQDLYRICSRSNKFEGSRVFLRKMRYDSKLTCMVTAVCSVSS